MRQTWLAGTLVAGLVAGALCVVPADAANRDTSAGIASAVDDPSLIAQGKIRTAPGKAAAAGIPVVLYVWPSNDVTDHMAVGDEAKLQQVSESTASADGSFALRIDDLVALQPMTGADQVVNFELTAGEGDAAVQYSFARKMGSISGQRVLVDAVADPANPGRPEPPPLLTVDLAAKTITDTSQGPSEPAPEGVEVPGSVQIPKTAAKGFSKQFCIARLQHEYAPTWELVGTHYHGTNQVSAVFYYISSATSELGVGYSVSGKFGSFKQSGTMAKSTNASVGYPPVGDFIDRLHYSRFSFGLYYVSCSQGGTLPSINSYEVRPYVWRGGARSATPAHQPTVYQKNCDDYERTTIFMKDKTRTLTWSNGADVSGQIGVDLSIRTGYSIGAKVQYGFNQHRQLCGSSGPATVDYQQLISWPLPI